MKEYRPISPVVGQRVRYRFWPSNQWHVGTVAKITVSNTFGIHSNVEIKRDGYRETAVMPAEKWFNKDCVQQISESADRAAKEFRRRAELARQADRPDAAAWLETAADDVLGLIGDDEDRWNESVRAGGIGGQR